MFEPARAIYIEQQQETLSGPLPPPHIFAQYQNVAPGAAELILDMARNEQAHRHRVEQTLAEGQLDVIRQAEQNRHREVRFGQIGGLALGVLVLVETGLLAYYDKPLVHFGVVIGVQLAALLGVFMYGQRQQRKALEKAASEDAEETSGESPGTSRT